MRTFPAALATAFALTFILQFLLPALRQRSRQRARRRTRTPRIRQAGVGLWVGLAVSTLVLALFQDVLTMPHGEHRGVGPPLWAVVLAAMPLLALVLPSDRSRPRSERHALGLFLSGLVMSVAGYSIFILTAPGQGTIALGPVLVIVVTVLWLVLLASMTELVSLLPLGLPLFGLALSAVVWLSGGPQQTVASYALAGIIAGAILGRLTADALRGRTVPWGKGEIFALGFWLTAMTNVAFLKSVAFAGFVLPLGVVAVVVVVLSLRAFERSLLLRDTPGPRVGE